MFKDVKDIEWNKLIEELRTYAVVYDDYEDRIEVSVHTGKGDPDFVIHKNPIEVVLVLTNDMTFAHNLECWSSIDRILNIINKYLLKDRK